MAIGLTCRGRLTRIVAESVDRPHLENLMDDHVLAQDAMDSSKVARIREDMERAEGRAACSRTTSNRSFSRPSKDRRHDSRTGAATARNHQRPGERPQPRPCNRRRRGSPAPLREDRFREGSDRAHQASRLQRSYVLGIRYSTP